MADNYRQWYEEAMVASNEAGYVGMSAAATIRALDAERDELADLLSQMTDEAKQLKDHKVALEISLEGVRAALNGNRKLVAELEKSLVAAQNTLYELNAWRRN